MIVKEVTMVSCSITGHPRLVLVSLVVCLIASVVIASILRLTPDMLVFVVSFMIFLASYVSECGTDSLLS